MRVVMEELIRIGNAEPDAAVAGLTEIDAPHDNLQARKKVMLKCGHREVTAGWSLLKVHIMT